MQKSFEKSFITTPVDNGHKKLTYISINMELLPPNV